MRCRRSDFGRFLCLVIRGVCSKAEIYLNVGNLLWLGEGPRRTLE